MGRAGLCMNSIADKVFSEGFAVVSNVLEEDEVVLFRELLNDYFRSNYLNFNGEKVVSGWSGITHKLGPMNNLYKDSRVTEIVEKVLGEDWIFSEHSGIHQDKITPWHNDILPLDKMDLLRYVYPIVKTLKPSDDGYKIINVCFLLQDHSDNEHGLWFKPCSNRQEFYSNKQEFCEQEICVHRNSTDLIVFDQRVEHRGQRPENTYFEKYKKHRYLVTMGYGVDNFYTKQHIAGTVYRQNQQRASMIREIENDTIK